MCKCACANIKYTLNHTLERNLCAPIKTAHRWNMKPSATEVTLEQTMTMTKMKVIPVASNVCFTVLHSPQDDNDNWSNANGNDNGMGRDKAEKEEHWRSLAVRAFSQTELETDHPFQLLLTVENKSSVQDTFKFQNDKKTMTNRVMKISTRPLTLYSNWTWNRPSYANIWQYMTMSDNAWQRMTGWQWLRG